MAAQRWQMIVFNLLVSFAYSQDTWCGKVYKQGSAEIIPGGRLEPPTLSLVPLLDVQVTPRYSIYIASEKTAEFIVDAALSYLHGSPYFMGSHSGHGRNTTDRLDFTIDIDGMIFLSNTVKVNTTETIFELDISSLSPRVKAYQVDLRGTVKSANTTYTATAELYYLPEKMTGSVVKIDYLYGSLLLRNDYTNGSFKPVIPYGFYGDYSGYFIGDANMTAYASMEFNAVNLVSSFADANMTGSLDRMDELDVLLQYDMRGSYQNLTSVAGQVPLVHDHPSLLTWYTGDEPDGWSYPLNSTKQAYDLLAQLDKYHPTALVLNCQNYYFKEYATGADIIMEDAYPVGNNVTWSTRWNTPCNETYGDCGCDNCIGSLLDVPNRIDNFHRYETWLGGSWIRKPVWAVPQAFESPDEYWYRAPSAEESWAMDLLAFNHGAKGRLAWVYPPADELAEADSTLARVITTSPVLDFLTGANPILLRNGSTGGLDVAYWNLGDRMLIGVVNPTNSSMVSVGIQLPEQAKVSKIEIEPWGDVVWSLDNTVLTATDVIKGLGTSYVILE